MGNSFADNENLKNYWQLCLSGDTTAFGYIHAALFEGLYGYAVKVLKSETGADDAVQELFIKIWSKRYSIGRLEKVKPYFFTTLRRQLLNQLRDNKAGRLFPAGDTGLDIEFSQEEIIIKKEHDEGIKEKILQVLHALPERQREVIYLHYFEDMTLAQVAGIMAVNYQSVQNLKQRALHNMRSANLFSLFLLLYTAHCFGEF
jgi:RNA polymerase sigma factor (sigma-70 family)